jgi:hypothetical protein
VKIWKVGCVSAVAALSRLETPGLLAGDSGCANTGDFGQGSETPAQDSGVSNLGVSLGPVMGVETFFSYPEIFAQRLA